MPSSSHRRDRRDGGGVLAADAQAKEPTALMVCGASRCVTITDRNRIQLAEQETATPVTPPAPAPFYRLRQTIDADGYKSSFWLYYVPSAGVLRAANQTRGITWVQLTSQSQKSLSTMAASVTPFPTPMLSGVTVDGKPVSGDTSSYLRLLSLPADETANGAVSDWVPIDLRASQPSPWTDGSYDLAFSASGKSLQRGSETVHLSNRMAEDIASGRALRDADDGLPWPLLVAVAALVAAAVLALVAIARRRARGLAPSSQPAA